MNAIAAIDQGAPFFFIHMADPQLGFSTNNEDLAPDCELFERAIEETNRLRPAFLVIGGDLLNTERSEKQAREFDRILAKLGRSIPAFLLPGNHDLESEDERLLPEALEWHRRRFGADYYSFQCGGCKFIALNSSLLKQPERAPEDADRQWKWLETELPAMSEGTRAFVFMHHPLFLRDPEEDDRYQNIPREQRRKLIALFAGCGVEAVFAGHAHQNCLARSGAMEMVVTSSISRGLGADPSGFRIVKVFEDSFEHRYYGLGQAPEEICLREDARFNAALTQSLQKDNS